MATQLSPPRFRLLSWILRHRVESKYNLSESGLPEPQLETMGVDTSLETFSLLKDDHEARLADTLADVYGVEP